MSERKSIPPFLTEFDSLGIVGAYLDALSAKLIIESPLPSSYPLEETIFQILDASFNRATKGKQSKPSVQELSTFFESNPHQFRRALRRTQRELMTDPQSYITQVSSLPIRILL